MKSMKKILALLLAMTMVMGLVACGNQNEPDNSQTPVNNTQTPDDTPTPTEPKVWDDLSGIEDPMEKSAITYEEALGDFWTLYQEAKAEVTDLDMRFAMMAEAEAKLLESGVMLPTGRNGGNYAISRMVPRTVTSTAWGYDSDRQHYIVVANELIKQTDRVAMITKWSELKGTGTYIEWAKQYLTEQGYTIADEYNYVYSQDPATWDVLATQNQVDAEPVVQTFTGLVEYDNEDIMQPALAESWEKSEDGMTYTFHIRQGVKWVDSQGREVADVKADDFVAGMQHMLDAKGGLEWLVDGLIVNATEYMDGSVGFEEVGVKAIDDYTVQYTLTFPASYFMTMLDYGIFAPMSRTYYESKGGKFGSGEDGFDASAETYTYGKDPNSIAYCGPYLISGYTEKNSINFVANPTYWDPDHVSCHTINWKYFDGSDPTATYEATKNNVLSGAGLNSSSMELAKTEGYFDEYAYVSATDSTAFMGFFNVNRTAYANANDETAGVSPKTDEQKALAQAALRNQSFRLAVCQSLDRANWNAQRKGEDLKLNSLCNSYVPGTFVHLENELTVDVGGQAVTFPAGTQYGEILQAYIDADGYDIQVWDPTGNDGAGSGDSFDGWYNPEAAKAHLEKAIAELAEYGFEISAENPVVLDLATLATREDFLNQGMAFKQSVESVLEGKVIINVVEFNDSTKYSNATYGFNYGEEANYDINTNSGWGPDYGDPCTYLDTFQGEGSGSMTKSIGCY